MEYLKYILIFLAGIAAGFFNVVAGGGSLITIPSLIFAGLPSAVANGTNRIAILLQNAVSIKKFKDKGYFDLKISLILGVTAIIGAVAGSYIAVDIKSELFNKLLAIIMIGVLFLTLFGNVKLKKRFTDDVQVHNIIPLAITFLFIGFYGGFIQAGTGFLVIAAFSLLGKTNLVKTNSIKVFVIFLYTIPSLIIFIVSGKINWIFGFILAAGNMIGAWLGTNFTINRGDKWIRIILTITVLAMAIKLIFF